MNFLNQSFDAATNPNVAVPVAVTGAGVNMFIDHLPIIINCGMVVYVFLLVCHKGWTFYNDYKDRKSGRKK